MIISVLITVVMGTNFQTGAPLSLTEILCSLYRSYSKPNNFQIINVFYSTTDEQVKRLKNNFKIYIKIDIQTATTGFGAVTPSSGSALVVLAKVIIVKIAS